MWYYHKQIHDPIPEGQLCAHGCGQSALFRGTGGKYTCVKNSFTCPKYLEVHSKRVKEQWATPLAEQRKEDARHSITQRLHNEETYRKSSSTRKKNYVESGMCEQKAKEFRYYSKYVRAKGRHPNKEWALSQGYEIGKFTYHVDHKLSVFDAWKAGLSEEIVNHPMNLQIVEYKANLHKGRKSSITVEELLESIKASVLPK
jgi:hypothetical protein